MTEQELMQELLTEVSAKVGVSVKGLWIKPYSSLEAMEYGPIDMAATGSPKPPHKYIGIGYSPGITKIFPREELCAELAHELGHISGGDWNAVSEHQADEFAASHGYAEAGISMLKRGDVFLRQHFGEVSYTEYNPDDPHGTTAERIAIMSKYLPKAEKAGV